MYLNKYDQKNVPDKQDKGDGGRENSLRLQ